MAARSSSRGAHPAGHRALRRTSPSPITTRTQSTRGRAAAVGAVNGGATSPRRGPKDVPVVAAPAPPGAGIEAGSLKWQHPFVDVFRSFHVGEWVQAEKCGDVTSVLVGCLQPLPGCASQPFFLSCSFSSFSLFGLVPPPPPCRGHFAIYQSRPPLYHPCALISATHWRVPPPPSTLLGHRVP